MKIKVGAFSDVYAWMVIDNEGRIIDQGYDESLEKAKEDAKNAEWLWRTHSYEFDQN